jgi:hypothetical protein
MTDKEKYQENKLKRRERRLNIKKLTYMKSDVNLRLRLLNYTDKDNENDYVVLLSELKALEDNITKLRRNKFMSSAYEFIPNNVSK